MYERLVAPRPGEAASAAKMEQLVNAARSARLRVTPPLRLSQGPEGTTLSLTLPPLAAAPVLRGPWWPERDPGNPGAWRFTNCFFNSGLVTVRLSAGETINNVQLMPGVSPLHVWVVFDLQTRTANIQSSSAWPYGGTSSITSRTLVRRHSVWRGGEMTDYLMDISLGIFEDL